MYCVVRQVYMLEVGEFGHNIKCVIFFRSNSSLVSVIVHDQIYYKVAVFRLFTRARSEFVFYCLDSLVPQLEFVPKSPDHLSVHC